MGENEIRDQLAIRLDLVEPGLRLVKTNYPLPNAEGSRGFVDILARDTTNSFVIIELKRSDSTAREALHELAKYVELFQREKGLGAADVRTIIVSTAWRELLVPFSQAAREWSVSLRGYALLLETDEVTPKAAHEVLPLAKTLTIDPTPVQLLIQNSAGNLNEVWRWATTRLGEVGAKNLIGFDLQHPTYDAGVYLALGRMDPEATEAVALSRLAEKDNYDLSDAPSGYEIEYAALYYFCREYVPGCTLEHVTPRSLASVLQDPAWQVKAVRRSGVFVDELLFPDDDLLGACSTTGGLSDIRFEGSARTSHQQQWVRFTDRIQVALAGNEIWSSIVMAWLDELSSSGEDAEVIGSFFNPCDLVTALVFGWPENVEALLPGLEVVASLAGKQRKLRGCLVSTGTYREASFAFRQAYRDEQEWWVKVATGEVWAADLEFVEKLGLRYAAFEWSDDFPEGAMLEYTDNKIVRTPPYAISEGAPIWLNCNPLPKLISDHHYEFQHLVLSLQQRVYRPL